MIAPGKYKLTFHLELLREAHDWEIARLVDDIGGVIERRREFAKWRGTTGEREAEPPIEPTKDETSGSDGHQG